MMGRLWMISFELFPEGGNEVTLCILSDRSLFLLVFISFYKQKRQSLIMTRVWCIFE